MQYFSYIFVFSYFNPRSYKRSDTRLDLIYERIDISIHAPTRGATCLALTILMRLSFQSTLLQEERRRKAYGIMAHAYFNPRSYKRSDCNAPFGCDACPDISIHAPTRGATKSHTMYPINAVNFNPRSYTRSDS